MVTDRGRSYDAQALSGVKQQKCLAHVLRSISDVVQTKTGRGRSFGKSLSALLREAMDLWRAYHRGEAEDFEVQAERLKQQLSYLSATARCRMRTATGCRTNLAGMTIVATCCDFWTIRTLSRPTTVLSERYARQ